MHDGKCPKCGRTLPFMPRKVEVKPGSKKKTCKIMLGERRGRSTPKGKERA